VTTSRIQRLMGVLYEKVGERKENARRESMLEVHNMYKIPTAREEGKDLDMSTEDDGDNAGRDWVE